MQHRALNLLHLFIKREKFLSNNKQKEYQKLKNIFRQMEKKISLKKTEFQDSFYLLVNNIEQQIIIKLIKDSPQIYCHNRITRQII
jgi:hypothetical protein